MSGAPLNKEAITVGDSIEIDLETRDQFNELKDSDALPTYEVFTPQLSKFTFGVGQKIDEGYYIAMFKIPKDQEVSDKWKITWSYSVRGESKTFEEFFEVLSDTATDQSLSVSIDDNTLTRIKGIIGAPFIDEELTLSDEQIKQYCLIPAFEVFFSKFPIQEIEQYNVSGESYYDFPSDNTFGVLQCSVVNKVEGNSSSAGSNFWNLFVFNKTFAKNGWSRTGYGTNNNFNGLSDQWDMKLQYLETVNNRLGTFKYNVDYNDRRLFVYSSISGQVMVKWAKYSYNIKNVKFSLRNFYIKLAQWYLLSHLVDTAELSTEDENTTSKIDTDKLRTKADKMKTEIDEFMNTYPDIIVLRAS